MLQRPDRQSLDGTWDFALDRDARWAAPEDVGWDRTITVPFAPETPASGIADTSFFRACWYRRAFDAPPLAGGQRLILHFGAVDHGASVWVNGRLAVTHEGGYTPFSADITGMLAPGAQQIVVRADDDPHDLAKPRGKQDWLLEPHGIWYPRTTGIWQTVWLERVPRNAIASLRWTASVERWEIALDATVDGPPAEGLRLRAALRAGDRTLADDTYSIDGAAVARRIALPDPGIDAARAELLWSPSHPALIDAHLQLVDAAGAVIDDVRSYTAMRSVAVDGDRFMLNGRPLRLRMVLDQGYWPDTGLTAPSDDALRRDVELAKAMGFNGVRKHQKIEDPRYLYWADRLGLLVWEEMPSAYAFTPGAVERLTREWIAAVRRDASHPCIVAWVPFNESWGVPDLAASQAQRDYVAALYHLTRTLDPTRPVIGNDGWEAVAGDIVGIHDYDQDAERVARRYGSPDDLERLFESRGPAGRRITVEGHRPADQPVMLTEFGGIAYSKDEAGTWGYSRTATPEDLARRYEILLQTVRALPALAGFCYTQFADTYQETNGLLYPDRTPKFPIEAIAAATRGR
jgi:hypothetical protein